eukprot:3529576-Prymnesium_polylepis.1
MSVVVEPGSHSTAALSVSFVEYAVKPVPVIVTSSPPTASPDEGRIACKVGCSYTSKERVSGVTVPADALLSETEMVKLPGVAGVAATQRNR